jgi:hypothetical protein
MKRTILLVAGLVLVCLPLCAGDGAFVDLGEGDPHAVAAPDPGARLCIALGGINRQADEGAWGGMPIGLCRLHDDSVIADWSLFDALYGGGSQAADGFLAGVWTPGSGPIETWADEACAGAGGTVVEYVEHLRPSHVHRLCEFPDGTLVETWTLFGGPGFYPELSRVLQPPSISGQGSGGFQHCPWPQTCMAPCLEDPPIQVLCRYTDGHVAATSFACCCCGSGTNSYAPLPGIRPRPKPFGQE